MPYTKPRYKPDKALQLVLLIRRIKFHQKESPMINIGIINNKGNKTVKDKKRLFFLGLVLRIKFN
jgi:hypothetical protein